MKKVFTLVFLLFACLLSNAQLNNEFLVGGSLGFGHSSKESDNQSEKSNAVSLYPSAGKFYSNNRLFGINGSYSRLNNKGGHLKYTNAGGGVFLRQYSNLTHSFYVFADEGIDVNFYKNESNISLPDQMSELKGTSIGAHFFPGLAFSASGHLMLEIALSSLVSLEHSHEVNKTYTVANTNTTTTNSLNLQTGAGSSALAYLTFGMRYLFK